MFSALDPDALIPITLRSWDRECFDQPGGVRATLRDMVRRQAEEMCGDRHFSLRLPAVRSVV